MSNWTGVTDPRWRKRLSRHVRDCPRCAARQRGLVTPEHLLLGISALPVPAALLIGVQTATHAGASATTSFFGHLQSLLAHKSLAAATVATVAVGGGISYAVYWTPERPHTDHAIVSPTAAVRTTPPIGAAQAPSSTSEPSATPTLKPATGTGVQSADIYVAPAGSDSGDGSAKRPYATLAKAVATVRPGQTIALRGGTYRPTAPISITTSGTAAKPIVLSNYRAERPIIDVSAIPADKWAITQATAYWTVQGLDIGHSQSHAYVCRGCRFNVFQRLSLHDNVRSGLLLRDPGTTGNKVLDSDFYANRDPAGGGIGLGIGFGNGDGNLVRGNRAFDNASAGFDLGGAFTSAVTVEYNWSYGNAIGFTFGGGSPPAAAPHRIRHNAAWDNTGHGFTDEGNTAALQLSNNTAFRNGGTGFALPSAAATLRSNAAVNNGTPDSLAAAAKASRNSWQLTDWTSETFRSTDASTAEGPRTATGRLPASDYLTTGNGVGASMNGT